MISRWKLNERDLQCQVNAIGGYDGIATSRAARAGSAYRGLISRTPREMGLGDSMLSVVSGLFGCYVDAAKQVWERSRYGYTTEGAV